MARIEAARKAEADRLEAARKAEEARQAAEAKASIWSTTAAERLGKKELEEER